MGPFTIHGQLGEGGMGVVYAGTDATGRRAAVKVVKSCSGDLDHLQQRFMREAQSLAKVESPWTARVLAADADNDPPYIASEFIDGHTLWDVVRDEGPMAVPDALAVGLALAEALVAMHAVGVIHRDLKPANVLMSARGPVVIDFGIAHLTDATALTSTSTTFGSAGWLAPEILEADAATTTACDVFGWGAILAYAATGRSPFGSGRLERILYRTLHDPPDIDGVDPQLGEALLLALRKAPDERPSLDVLMRMLRAAGPRSMTLSSMRTTKSRVSRWPSTPPLEQVGDPLAQAWPGPPAVTPGPKTAVIGEVTAPAMQEGMLRGAGRLKKRWIGAASAAVLVAAAGVTALLAPDGGVQATASTDLAGSAPTPAAQAQPPAPDPLPETSVTPNEMAVVKTPDTEPSSTGDAGGVDTAQLPDCAAPCEVLHTLRQDFVSGLGSEQVLAFAGNQQEGVGAYLLAGEDPELVAHVPDLGVMQRFPRSGYWIRYDSTGNIFINVTGASATALVAIAFGGAEDMRVVGPEGDGSHFLSGDVAYEAEHGDFVIQSQWNDCDPSCAEGSVLQMHYYWTGEAYAPVESQ